MTPPIETVLGVVIFLCQTRSDLETAGERIRLVYFAGKNIAPAME